MSYVVLTGIKTKKYKYLRVTVCVCLCVCVWVCVCVVLTGYSIGAVSGANLNPAVSVAIDVSYGLLHGGIWRFIVCFFASFFLF